MLNRNLFAWRGFNHRNNIYLDDAMKLLSLMMLTCVSLGVLTQSQTSSTAKTEIIKKDRQLSSVAESTKQGVIVRINQVQMQRIGTDVELAKHFAKFGIDSKKFSRTIAIAVSKKNAGKSSGPISITLKNGDFLTPMMNGNQKLMSAIANSSSKDGFDFEETWFEIPANVKFEQVFPISISFRCTDKAENPVQFQFENITP